ncbi:MAG: hypothetical protein ACSHXY_09760 [Alphaproteobacteria bacterium]
MKLRRYTLSLCSALLGAFSLLCAPMAAAAPTPVDGVYAQRSTSPSGDPALISDFEVYVLAVDSRTDDGLFAAYWMGREAGALFDIEQERAKTRSAQAALKNALEHVLRPEYAESHAPLK